MTPQLTGEMIDAGRFVTQRLIDEMFPVHASFWIYDPEAKRWGLMIATPPVLRGGPRGAYQRVHNILVRNPALALGITREDINLIEPTHALVRVLGTTIWTDKGTSGIRITRETINGEFIEDAYIYRLLRD